MQHEQVQLLYVKCVKTALTTCKGCQSSNTKGEQPCEASLLCVLHELGEGFHVLVPTSTFRQHVLQKTAFTANELLS